MDGPRFLASFLAFGLLLLGWITYLVPFVALSIGLFLLRFFVVVVVRS